MSPPISRHGFAKGHGFDIINGNDAQGHSLKMKEPCHRAGTNPITGLPYDGSEPARPRTSQRRMSVSSVQQSREHFDILSNKPTTASPAQQQQQHARSPPQQRQEEKQLTTPAPAPTPTPTPTVQEAAAPAGETQLRIDFLREKIKEGNFYAQSAYQAGEHEEMDKIVSYLCQMEDELNALLAMEGPTQPPPKEAWSEQPPPEQQQQQIEFVPSAQYAGYKHGFKFQMGPAGLGYYPDPLGKQQEPSEWGIGNRMLPDRHTHQPVGGEVEAGYGIGNRILAEDHLHKAMTDQEYHNKSIQEAGYGVGARSPPSLAASSPAVPVKDAASVRPGTGDSSLLRVQLGAADDKASHRPGGTGIADLGMWQEEHYVPLDRERELLDRMLQNQVDNAPSIQTLTRVFLLGP